MKKKLSILLILIMLSVVFTPFLPPAATEQSPLSLLTTEAEAASIRLNTTSSIIPLRMYRKLSVKGTSQKVSWSSSKKSVAAVTSHGIVTANKTGNAVITAKVAGKTLKCRVTVIDRYSARQVGNAVLRRVRKNYKRAHLVSYKRNGNTVRVVVGRPVGEGAPGMEVNVNIKTGKAVCDPYWSDFFSALPRTFSVWKCGKTVKVSRITLNKTSASVVKGKTITLKATASPSKATNKSVIWSSSNKKVATVSGKGVVKGIANGTARITARAVDGSGRKAACTVTVKTATSGVPNVTDSVLKMTAERAAKYLKLTKKVSEYNPEIGLNEYYYIRKGRRFRDGSPWLYCPTIKPARAGDWDIVIEDKSIAFQGVKVGMSESGVKKILGKKWRYDYKYYPDTGEYGLSYSRNLNHSWSWLSEDGRAQLGVIFNKKTGKVKSIHYYTDTRD